jgi:hypothetical protein
VLGELVERDHDDRGARERAPVMAPGAGHGLSDG